MIIKLLTEHHLEFLSLKGAAEAHPSLHLSNCWKSHALAHFKKGYTNISGNSSTTKFGVKIQLFFLYTPSILLAYR